jgi:hypothetical protein
MVSNPFFRLKIARPKAKVRIRYRIHGCKKTVVGFTDFSKLAINPQCALHDRAEFLTITLKI